MPTPLGKLIKELNKATIPISLSEAMITAHNLALAEQRKAIEAEIVEQKRLLRVQINPKKAMTIIEKGGDITEEQAVDVMWLGEYKALSDIAKFITGKE